MPEEFLMPVVMVIAAIVLLSFALGTNWNVRKGHQILKWLTEGLPVIGDKTTYRWLGSSVMELKIAKAKGAFRNTETLIVFEPRDILLLWWWSRLRGRRDMVIFRGQLQSAPGSEIEVFDPQGWTTHSTERDVKAKNWAQFNLPANAQLLAYHSAKAETDMINQIVDQASRLGGKLVRLSVHRDVPNLEIHWWLPDIKTKSAENVFSTLQQIGQEVMKG